MPTPIYPLRLDEDVKARAIAKAAAQGLDLAAVLRGLLLEWLDEDTAGAAPGGDAAPAVLPQLVETASPERDWLERAGVHVTALPDRRVAALYELLNAPGPAKVPVGDLWRFVDSERWRVRLPPTGRQRRPRAGVLRGATSRPGGGMVITFWRSNGTLDAADATGPTVELLPINRNEDNSNG